MEIDESAFGKRKYEHGRLTAVKWVFVGVERGTGDNALWSRWKGEIPRHGIERTWSATPKLGRIYVAYTHPLF